MTAIVGRHEVVDVAADRLVVGVAEEPLGGGVPGLTMPFGSSRAIATGLDAASAS